ncbi:hypothetical protein ACLOJK_022341 [Asimina triloba]
MIIASDVGRYRYASGTTSKRSGELASESVDCGDSLQPLGFVPPGRDRGQANQPTGTEHRDRRGFQFERMKLEFLIFSLGDPGSWIVRADNYFDLCETPERKQIRIASQHLNGDAIE